MDNVASARIMGCDTMAADPAPSHPHDPLEGVDAGDQPGDPEAPSPAAVAQTRVLEMRRTAWWWIRAAAITLTVFLAYQLIVVFAGFISAVLTVVLFVVFGAVVSFIASPGVDALVRYLRFPRTLAILTVLGGGLTLIGLLIYLAAGPVVDEARTLANQVPALIGRAQGELNTLEAYLKDRNVPVSGIDLGASQKDISSRLSSLLLSSITGTATAVVDVVIILVVAFWLLKDGEKLRTGMVGLLPGALRVNVEFGLDATAVVIGGYVRAQLFLALIIGALAGIGCAIIGVPFPLVVAIAAGIFELIPLIGPFAGGAVALLLALTVSPTLALVTVFLFIGIHVIEGYVLAPRIQAKFVQLHPLVALLALFTGIEVGGFLGAFFAVPAASLIAVFIRAAVGDWRATRPDLFTIRRGDYFSEQRRETILGEFRFFKRSPLAMLRGALSPRRRRPEPPGD
ncbi:MAG TPA: AI-2E family transporter [Candidatus Dormibacteraeota bacterium]|nr:AI-2E family transporter [Candidatus Dormibacteraeota bacterium]